MTPKKFLIACAAWFVWFLCMFAGAFVGAGVAACIWGADVVHTFGTPAAWSHPRVLAMDVSDGAGHVWSALPALLAAIVLPVYIKFRIPMRRKGQPYGWIGA